MTGATCPAGEATFPCAPTVCCDAYEFDCAAVGPAELSLRFLVPHDPGPREFWLEESTRAVMESAQGARLAWPGEVERIVEAGHRMFAEFEDPKERNLHAMYMALFACRNDGHHAIRRRYKAPADFIDFSSGEPAVLVPGLIAPATRRRGRDVHRSAPRILAEALAQAGQPCGKTGPCFGDVLQHCERLVAGSGGKLDSVRAEEYARAALIAGPVYPDDFTAALADVRFEVAVHRLVRLSQKGQERFRNRLKQIREHRYLDLVGKRSPPRHKRDEANQAAERIACALLWRAYQYAAQCYSVVMLLARLAFVVDLRLSEEEAWLFRQRHGAQPHLGGLPLAFFGAAQQRWVYRQLNSLWRQGEREPSAYAPAAGLLGLLGTLVRERRASESEPNYVWDKHEGGRRAQGESPAQEKGVEELTSRDCARCGNRLRWFGHSGSLEAGFVVDLRCDKCDETRRCLVRSALLV